MLPFYISFAIYYEEFLSMTLAGLVTSAMDLLAIPEVGLAIGGMLIVGIGARILRAVKGMTR